APQLGVDEARANQGLGDLQLLHCLARMWAGSAGGVRQPRSIGAAPTRPKPQDGLMAHQSAAAAVAKQSLRVVIEQAWHRWHCRTVACHSKTATAGLWRKARGIAIFCNARRSSPALIAATGISPADGER